jgi:hypothetical protein
MDFTITARIRLQSVYNTRSTSLFSRKHLRLMSHILNVSSVINCVLYFFCFKKYINNLYVCLIGVCRNCWHKGCEKMRRNEQILCAFISVVYRNCVDKIKYYRHFLSSVIVVKNFHPPNYCYFKCYCCCYYCCYSSWFVLCFPFLVLHQPPKYPSPLLLQSSHTLDLLYRVIEKDGRDFKQL